jgi:hypothetical protein
MLSLILKSKAFWLAVIDMVGGLLTLLGAAFWPDKAELVKSIWGMLQPVLLVIIAALATEDIVVPLLVRALR